MSLKKIKNEDISVSKEFIKKFRADFKVSTIVWILMIVVGGVLLLDFHISNLVSNGILSIILKFISTLVGVIYLFSLTYIFPIISKFDNTIKNTVIDLYAQWGTIKYHVEFDKNSDSVTGTMAINQQAAELAKNKK